jgi:hypothetical protein
MPAWEQCIPQDGAATVVTGSLDFAQDHDCVPHPFGQQLVDLGFVGIEFALAFLASSLGSPASLQCPTDGLGMYSQLVGNVLVVDTPLFQCFNHDIVLLTEHMHLLLF